MIELLTTIIQTPYTSEVLYKFLTGIATGIVLGFETDYSCFCIANTFLEQNTINNILTNAYQKSI